MNERTHRSARTVLRTLGPLLLGLGAVCLVISLIDFFGGMGGSGRPKLFWLGFVGIPLLFAGAVMSMMGYMGVVARYQGREIGPAASATFNDMAKDSAPGVRAVGAALREGMRDGDRGDAAASADTPPDRPCPACDQANDFDAKFCRACGGLMPAPSCPACGHLADPGAKFCDDCGAAMAG